jgi:hypothetical protein
VVIPLPYSIQDIFSVFKAGFINSFDLAHRQLFVLNRITSCRTENLGGFIASCPDCSRTTQLFHSCSDRHCPVCQGSKQKDWAEAQMANALPIPYFHIVFTIPASLNRLILSNQAACYDLLFDASSEAIVSLCKSMKHLGFNPGFTSVLHTWGQTLQYHPHIHVMIPAGGISKDGRRFVLSQDNFFIHVKALSKVFRAILLKKLKSTFCLKQHFVDELYSSAFVINIEKPFKSPSNVIKYLARYTQKVAISNSRITHFDKSSGIVTFSYKDNRDGGKLKHMSLHALEFMRRFFMHILPKGFTKIRHYGFLALRSRKKNLDRAFALLKKVRLSPVLKFVPLSLVCSDCGANLSFREVSAWELHVAKLKAS